MGIILSMIWIALVFNERVEDNKRIKVEAAAQLAYNNTYELYQKQLSADVEEWAIKTCASFNHSYENECVRLAVQEHHGFGWPHPTELCSLIAQAEQAVGLDTSSSDLLQAVRETIGQTGCDPEKPSALPIEKPISGYLSKALLPPLGFAVVIWACLAIYSRISRLALVKSILKPSPVNSALPQPRPLEPASPPQDVARLTKKQISILSVLALLLFFGYAVVLERIIDGVNDTVGKNAVGKDAIYLMFFTGWAFWYFWKVRNRKGWIGGVVGVAVSILVIILSVAIDGYVRGQPDYVLEHTPAFSALKKHFPKEYESMYQELIALAKEKKLTIKDVSGLIDNKIVPLLSQALKTTSDPAILLFGKAKLSAFRDVAKVNSADCYVMMFGNADTATQIRISKSMSQETSALNKQAMQKVIEDSGTYRQTMDSPTSEARSKTLFTQLDAILTRKYSLSTYDSFDDTHNMPADVRCKAGIALFEEIMNLPSDDSAFMLREFLAH